MVQGRREAVCGVSGDSLGHPLLLQLYVAWEFFFFPPLVEKFNVEKSEGRLCVLFFRMWFPCVMRLVDVWVDGGVLLEAYWERQWLLSCI